MSQHHFNVQFAEKYGLREAIVINHIDFWLSININNLEETVYFPKILKKRFWVFFKPGSLESHFPYMKPRHFTESADKLYKSGVLIKAQLGGTKRNNYYTFTEEFLMSNSKELLSFQSYHKRNLVDGTTKNGECSNDNNIMMVTSKDVTASSTEALPFLLTEQEKEYIPVIEYWNSKAQEIKDLGIKSGPSVHNIPNDLDDNSGKGKKVIKDSLSYIVSITSGNFFTLENFNGNTIYDHPDSIDIKFIYEGIDVLMEQYKTAKNTKSMPKGLASYLCTDKQGYTMYDKVSPFYRDFFSKRDYGVIGHDIPKDIIDMYKKLFGANLTKEWEMGIDTMLKKLYTVFERNQYLSKYSQKYAIHLGSEKAFFETHYKFLKANFYHMDDFHIGMLKNHGKIWERFTAWLYDNYNIKLDLSADQQRMMKQRYKILSIKKGVHSEEDFDEDNNLIN